MKNFLSRLIILMPLLIVIVLWSYMEEEYKNPDFATLLFTLFIFSLAFFIPSIITSREEKREDKKIFFYSFLILIYSFYIVNTNRIYIENISQDEIDYFLCIVIIVTIIKFILSTQPNIINLVNNISNSSLSKYSKVKEFSIYLENQDNSIWKNLDKIFTDNYKKESSNLLKKNNLRDIFLFHSEKASVISISKLKNFSNILHTFHEAIKDINKKNINNNNHLKEEEMLSKLIYQVKFIHYKMALVLVFSFINSIIHYFFNLLTTIVIIFIFSSETELFIDFINLIKYSDLLTFLTGFLLFILSIPLSYTYFIFLKFYFLKVHKDSTHDDWIVFYKNLSYYLLTFLLTILLLIISLTLLSHSGLEYNDAFHFISTLILPTIELQNLPSLLSNLLSDDIIFAIINIKILFLIFVFLIFTLLIKHLLELYIELYEESKNSKYSIPPEFAHFFSYLMLSIFALILMYGTLFINYPSLEKEYKHCQSYMTLNNKTKENCTLAIKKNTNDDVIKEYCHQINTLENNNRLSDFKYCSIGMSIETNPKYTNYNTSFISPNPSLSDYIPLSIFLTLFGAIMMISTKNLLENYFTGLSLKINTPFEEGERIRIDDGEMLSVKNIGFRATTFYGISSHAHLVIPHKKLTNSVIINYTQPTLDYREKITIYIPDRKLKNGKSIPREAEKILLLAAFISTGVKKPKLKSDSSLEKEYSENSENYFNTRDDVNKKLKENEKNNEKKNQEIWTSLKEEERKKLFFNELYKLVNKEDNNHIVIKKIVSSIVTVIDKYQTTINSELPYSIDEFNIKRKSNILNRKTHEDLQDICDYLVKINYYYFSLAKQLWLLKSEEKSDQQKNIFDQASLELLDVPRVTSAHKRDMEGAFWEVSLLVTVELAEQSDEIVQHINMFIDELWDIFELPSRCNDTID